jgi:predicted  nucleic acid-binding Zn-ribbon protein
MASSIDNRLVSSYRRIRGAAKNGLAVVPIEREASAGSFIKIPPQRQIDIAQRKRIIVDEHSGRILVDKELADEELTRMNELLDKELAKLKK